MTRRKLLWRILPPWVLITVASMLAVTWYASVSIRDYHRSVTRKHLRASAQLMAQRIAALPGPLDPAEIQRLCRDFGEASGHRMTVIRPDGTVIGDNEEAPAYMDNHRDRPEIRRAIADGFGGEVRRSDTLRISMMYVALPVIREGRTFAVVRSALSLADMDAAVAAMQQRIVLAGLVVALLTAIVSMAVTRRITHPLQAIYRGARSVADGDLAVRLPSSEIAEINLLSETMNHMAVQLGRRMRLIQEQRDEYEAVLASMNEAVLAVDRQKELIKVNRSAEELFGIDLAPGQHPDVASAIRNADLLSLVERALDASEQVQGDIHIESGDKYLRAQAAPLHGAGGSRNLGAVVVLHDVTQLRRLETMRRDFVANVSHELKTPITSIKGFAETLISGAAEDREDRERFIAIIRKQSERLEQIIEDLLVLSRIEHDTGNNDVPFTTGRLEKVLRKAVQSCEKQAAEAGIKLRLTCGEPLEVEMNSQLVEQAVLNLIDNAIKYSASDTEVTVSAGREGREIVVRVADQGPGIAARHLPRIFERFYRVDKSRSRNLGGTGLGLAIVKRIAIAHGGRVDVQSRMGAGSVFAVYLPARRNGQKA